MSTREPDDRLRRALRRLDGLAHRRVAVVTAQASEAAQTVVDDTAAHVQDRVRQTLAASAWMAIGLAVGLGLYLGSRR